MKPRLCQWNHDIAPRERQFGEAVHQQHQRIVGRPRLEDVLAAAEQPPFCDDPGIHLFYLAAKIQQAGPEAAETYFRELVTGLEERGNLFPPDDHRNLLVLAINYGLRRANAGWEPAVPLTFNLYRLGLSRNIIYQHGQLSLFSFNNILALVQLFRQHLPELVATKAIHFKLGYHLLIFF